MYKNKKNHKLSKEYLSFEDCVLFDFCVLINVFYKKI